MVDYTDEQLENMSDEELEAAANEARLSESTDENNDEQNEETPSINNDEPGDNVDNGEPVIDGEEENPEDNGEPDDEVKDENPDTLDEGEGQDNAQPEPKDNDTKEKPSETPQELEPLKVNGKMIPINSMEELYTLASGGAAVTKKFQEIAAHKKSIAIMQEHNLTEADLSLLIEARNGSKDALASLVKQSGIDSMDVTDKVSDGYQPGAYIPDESAINLREVQQEISVDPEYQLTQNIVNNFMDEPSQDMMIKNPEIIRGIHQDVKSGAYELVSAHAQKLKLMDGGRRPFMEYYIQAAQEGPAPQEQVLNQNIPQQQAPLNNQQPQKRNVDKSKKRSAGSNKQKSAPASVKDINDMTDEELMAYREKIMERF